LAYASDQKENLSNTEWTVDGKIRKAMKTRTINNGTNTFVQELEISYFYTIIIPLLDKERGG
jgi:hypothetical protein